MRHDQSNFKRLLKEIYYLTLTGVCLKTVTIFLVTHYSVTVFHRWKQGEDGKILEKEGKSILEFVAIKSTNSSERAIPEV